MDFLENLLNSGDRKHQNRGGFLRDDHHHDDDHDDHHDHRDYPNDQPYNLNQQLSPNHNAFLPGVMCRKCTIQTVQGAKFCHACGTAIDLVLNCASCGSKLPALGTFCPQCGYKNG
jgi:ribosomal protein L40E